MIDKVSRTPNIRIVMHMYIILSHNNIYTIYLLKYNCHFLFNLTNTLFKHWTVGNHNNVTN